MARSRRPHLAAATALVALAACSGGGANGERAATPTAPTPPIALDVAPSQVPRMVLEAGPVGPTVPSDDPRVSEAGDPEDYVARLRRLQRAIFPDHVAPPVRQTGVTTRGVSDDAVRIGVVSTLTGGDASPDACRGALARLARTGAHHTVDAYQEYIVERYGGQTLPYAYAPSGTVNGRDLEVVGSDGGPACRDDGADPAHAGAHLRDLVGRQQVFAVLAPGATGLATTGALDEQHVPVVGFGTASAWCGTGSPYATPAPSAATCDALGDRLVVRDVALPAYLTATGRDPAGLRVAVVGAGPAADDAREVRLQVARAGSTVVYDPPGERSTAGTQWARDLVASGADLAVVLAPAADPDVVAALRTAGFTGDVVSMAPGDDTTAAATAFRVDGADGRAERFDSVLAPSAMNPALSLIRADLDGAGYADVAITPAVVSGWATADLFVDALTRTPEPLTAEAFANFVNGGSYAYAGAEGLVCPVVLPLARVAPTPCGALSPSTDLAYYDLFLAAR